MPLQETERRWKVNDRVVVTCDGAYKGRVGTVIKIDKGRHPLVALHDPPKSFGSPAWFLSHEVEEAPDG